MDYRSIATEDTNGQPLLNCPKQTEIFHDTLSFEKLMYEGTASELTQMNPTEESLNQSVTTMTVPSAVVDDIDENDDPPPYNAIVPPNHVGWPFDFSAGIPYSTHTVPPCRAEAPLAPFQTSLTTGSSFHPEGFDGQHTSISVPLMPYRIFNFGSHRSLFMPRITPFSDDRPLTKGTTGIKRYGAILVAAAVIIFLMALSLLVRFVMERSFWRG